MSQYNTSGHKSFVATAALGEGVAVKLSSGQVIASTGATDKTIGVTTFACNAGDVVDVRLRAATAKVRAGGTIAVGDYVTTTTAGEVIATTTTGNVILGMALEAAVDNDFFEIMLMTDRF